MLKGMIEDGQKVTAVDYNKAVDGREFLNDGLAGVFDRYDAIITPAAVGEAPAGLDSTGSPIFNSLWTYCGTPAITLPLMEGPNGLPLGVQVVGRRGDDARLLRTARWLAERVAEAAAVPQSDETKADSRMRAMCRARRPVPLRIWWRQLVPSAQMTVSAAAARTAGSRLNSPIFMDMS